MTKKQQAVEEAESNVTNTEGFKDGSWGFRHRESAESPWIRVSGLTHIKATAVRRLVLTNKARKSLGLGPISLDAMSGKNWQSNILRGGQKI